MFGTDSRRFKQLKVLWTILRRVGLTVNIGRQMDSIFRYYVLKALSDDGFFEYIYIKEPRKYIEILADRGFAQNDYTHDLLEVLSTEKRIF